MRLKSEFRARINSLERLADYTSLPQVTKNKKEEEAKEGKEKEEDVKERRGKEEEVKERKEKEEEVKEIKILHRKLHISFLSAHLPTGPVCLLTSN